MNARKPLKILAIIGFMAGLLTLVMVTKFAPKIIYNPSPSAPIGFYSISQKFNPKVGDYILLELPGTVKSLALDRHYVGQNIPLLKQVFASSGDHVCVKNGVVYVNHETVSEVKSHDPSGREMPVWHGCEILKGGTYFLLNTHSPYSFDSRYFGPIEQEQIIGVALFISTDATE